MIILSIGITLAYLALIGGFVFGYDKIKDFVLHDHVSKTKFSVVIPFRNESKNLPQLLKSIETLNYPKNLFEVILIDDASEDNSLKLVEQFINCSIKNIILISNERTTASPKKDAISLAINQAQNSWIITSDADCILPKYWLDSFDEYIQQHDVGCIAAPVTYYNNDSFLSRFQLLDLLSLQGATIGGFGINKPFLCNGANFAYKKSLFLELNGFKGNTKIASGDDIFFLEKVVNAYPKQVHFLKCKHAIVRTAPESSWKKLIAQRIRWASKTSAYNNWFGKLTGGIVLLMNSCIILALILSFTGAFRPKILIYFLIIKLNIDFFLIYKSSRFLDQSPVLKSYPFGFLVYPFFSVYVAIKSFYSGYKWKDRSFKS